MISLIRLSLKWFFLIILLHPTFPRKKTINSINRFINGPINGLVGQLAASRKLRSQGVNQLNTGLMGTDQWFSR